VNTQTALIVDGESISTRDLLHGYKVRHGAQFLEEAIIDTLIRQAGRELPPVDTVELQKAADEFRRQTGLFEVQATEAWLKQNGLSLEDWEERLSAQLIARRLRDRVTADQVEAYFASNRAALDRAVVSQILVGEEEVAAELLAQITEEGADFAQVAREYSRDEVTRARGGYLGPIGRSTLGAEAEALVFGASTGQTVGPAKTDRGWLVLRVEDLNPAELDDGTREQIKDALFWEWLQQRRAKARVETPVLDTV
jgi:putative peptide maturation system protein